MIPPHSCPVPGRKPGTSTKVSTGMLKQSQVRTNRAAFSEASMSRVPAKCMGWLATTPTLAPSTRPNPTTMFCAKPAWISRNSPSSRMRVITSCMSYGWFGESGISVSSSSSDSVISRPAPGSPGGARTGGSSRLLDGR